MGRWGKEDIPAEIRDLCRTLTDAGHQAYVVGGSVRDLLLGREAHDWDVTTSARPEQVQSLFRKTIPVGIEHGTVAVLHRGQQIEVTTFRGEGAYSDGRHPDEVVFVGSLEEDLQRRDLTINAMAIDPSGPTLLDPIGGELDLTRRLIRAVGEAAERFSEDGLRTLRAIRFAAVLEFELEPATRAAISAALPSFRKVSWERIRDELLKILGSRRPSVGLELMRETGLLEVVLPELLACQGVSQNRFHQEDVYQHSLMVCDATRGDPVLRLAALLHDLGKPLTAAPHEARAGEQSFHGHERAGEKLCAGIGARLKLSREEQRRVCHLVRHHNFPLEGWRAAGIRRFIRRVEQRHLEDLFALRRGDFVGRDGPDQLGDLEALEQRVQEILRSNPPLSARDLALGGRELMTELPLGPGPELGKLIAQLVERVLDDPSLNTRDRLLALARELQAPE